jgi:hypothetical protein
MLVDDTATDWGQPGVPDTHLAIQYWRDPLVVSTAATSAAITVKFQRDIQPSGPGYADAVTTTGPSGWVTGTTAEPEPGTLVWTPTAALPAGHYTATVSQISSTGLGGVPIREPYTFNFTITEQ